MHRLQESNRRGFRTGISTGVGAKLWVVWGLKEKSTMVPMSYCGQCTVGTMPCLPVHMKTKDKGVEQGAGAVL